MARDGKKTPPDELAATKLAIQANKFVLRRNSVRVSEGTFTLDPARKAKEIDETITAGPNRGKPPSPIAVAARGLLEFGVNDR